MISKASKIIKPKQLTSRKFTLVTSGVVCSLLISLVSTPLFAVSPFIEDNTYVYNPIDNSVSCMGASADDSPLVGESNLHKVYNYFLGKGVSNKVAAAIVGNIYQESKGDPLLIQGGGRTTDPSTVGRYKDGSLFENKAGQSSVGKAWGLIQWDPGNAALYWQKRAGVTGNIATLEVQLQVTWWHLNNLAPTSKKNILAEMEAAPSLSSATEIMVKRFFGAGKPMLNNRIQAAVKALSYPVDPSIVVNDPDPGITNTGGTCAPGAESAVGVDIEGLNMYYQDESPWASMSYGGKGSIKQCGCGPTSAAIVVSTLKKDKSITPKTMADFFAANGGQLSGSCGSSWFWQSYKFKNEFGVQVNSLGTDLSKMKESLVRGSLIIISTGSGGSNSTPFSSGGHILVVRGITEKGNFLVANPYSKIGGVNQTLNKEGYPPSAFPAGSPGLKGAWEIKA